MGEFERALVQYERGTRVRKVTTVIIISFKMKTKKYYHQDPALIQGMHQCRDTILNTVNPRFDNSLVQVLCQSNALGMMMMILMRLKLTVRMKNDRLKRRDVDIQFS